MDTVSLPRLYLNETNIALVTIHNSGGDPVTGLAYDDMTVEYTRQTDTAMQTLSLTPSDWDERGRGIYALSLSAAVCSVQGSFGVYVAPPTASGSPFWGISEIDKRVEIRVMEATATGYSEPQVGKALEDAAGYEVKVSPQYNYTDSKIDFLIWLERGGQAISSPTSATLQLIEKTASGDTIKVDVSSASPDANGVFYIEKTSLVLSANKNYSIVATVTYNGVTYTSAAGGQTLN